VNVPESGCSPLLGQAPADAEGKLLDKRGLATSSKDYRPSRVRHRVREAARSAALWGLGLLSLARPDHRAALRRPRVHFLYSHHVFDDEAANYNRMIGWLESLLNFVSYTEGCRRLREGAVDGAYGTVSFDDGLRNNLQAARILSQHGVSACFFVCPGFVGSTDGPALERFGRALSAPPCELLSWDDLAELRSMGHEVGGHTMTHVDLSTVGPERAADEIGRCREELVRRLGPEAGQHFAWPYGAYRHMTPEAARVVFDSGFRTCASAMRGAHDAALEGRARVCLRREHLMATWPRPHVRYFLASSAMHMDGHSADWPAGWEATIGAT